MIAVAHVMLFEEETNAMTGEILTVAVVDIYGTLVTMAVVVIVVIGHLKSLKPQKSRFSSFKNNTGPTDGR